MELAPANDRGFLKGKFQDRYGEQCSIQKSSLATEDCIWLGRDQTVDKQGRPCGARMHLTQEMVADLIPILQHFVETGELPRSQERIMIRRPDYDQHDREALIQILRHRDDQFAQCNELWMRAAEDALAGDTRNLANRVELFKATDAEMVRTVMTSPVFLNTDDAPQ